MKTTKTAAELVGTVNFRVTEEGLELGVYASQVDAMKAVEAARCDRFVRNGATGKALVEACDVIVWTAVQS